MNARGNSQSRALAIHPPVRTALTPAVGSDFAKVLSKLPPEELLLRFAFRCRLPSPSPGPSCKIAPALRRSDTRADVPPPRDRPRYKILPSIGCGIGWPLVDA